MDTNNPPPEAALEARLRELEIEAEQALDGGDIATEEQAVVLGDIFAKATEAGKDAAAAQRDETGPHYEAVNVAKWRWARVITHAESVKGTCRRLLKEWRHAQEERNKDTADTLARQAIERQQEMLAADTDEEREALAHQADAAAEAAKRARQAKPSVKVGDRSLRLRTYYNVEIVDFNAAARWAWRHDPAAIEKALRPMIERLAKAAAKDVMERGDCVPGVAIHKRQEAE